LGCLLRGRVATNSTLLSCAARPALPDGTPTIFSGGDDGTARVWRGKFATDVVAVYTVQILVQHHRVIAVDRQALQGRAATGPRSSTSGARVNSDPLSRLAEAIKFPVSRAPDECVPFVPCESEHGSLGILAVADADPTAWQVRDFDAVAVRET
jgi:hypothetical protein